MIALAYLHLAAFVVALVSSNADVDETGKAVVIALLVLSGVALSIVVIA